MGNASFSQQPLQDPRAYIQNDLPKFIVQNRLGNGKFMKTYSATIDSSSVVIKVYIKPSDEDLTAVSKRLSHLLRTFSPMIYPNILPYQMWIKSSLKLPKTNATPVYLIRQYLHMNLHDRLSTRPFFNETEKIWVIFQLFKILDICHSSGIMHGDVKPENIMCTSWNFIILTDFASCFKPINIPDDNPTDFQYYYDVMNRQSCYIAPERFQRKNINSNEDYNNISDYGDMESWTPAMDVFSLGCTIAEIWLNGEPLLDLPGMLKYVSQSVDRLDHEDSPAKATLNKVNNRLIREVIADMTQRDPERRLSIKQYFDILEGKAAFRNSNTVNESPIFSPYFSECIYPLFTRMHFEGLTPDSRIGIICETYSELIKSITGNIDDNEKSYFSYAMKNIMFSNDSIDFTSISLIESEKIISSDVEIAKKVAKSLSAESLFAARKRNLVDGQTTMSGLQSKKIFFQNKFLEAMSSDVSNSSQKEDYSNVSLDELIKSCRSMINSSKENKKKEGFNLSAITTQVGKLFKVDSKDTKTKVLANSSNIADAAMNISYEADAAIGSNPTSKTFFDLSKSEVSVNEAGEYVRPAFQDLSIFLQLICSNFRHLKYPHSKIVSLMLLVRVGQRCPDDIILERIIPTLLIALDDLNSVVRATAIRSIRSLIVIVQSFAAFEANIFPQYIFPALNRVAKDPDVIVRSAFAETIGILAETSKRFLDKTHMIVLSKSLAKPASSLTAQSNDQESLNVINFAYDAKLKVLHDQISRWIRDLVMDTGLVDIRQGSGLSSHGSIVKRVLLVDIMRLCVFFGQESTMDLLLTQLLTFLNDQDWELRYAFCAKIASVCAFLGPTVSSDCILPCIENALVDVEEKVVLRAIQCLTNLIELSLLSTLLIVDTVKNVTPLLLHPSKCVRNAAIQLVAAAAKLVGTTDASVLLLPIIKSTLRFDLTGIEIDSKIINLCLLPPLSRRSYRKAILSRQSSNGKSVEVPAASNEVIEPRAALDSSYSGLVKVKQEAGGGYSLGEEDPEEIKKLAIMSSYLDAAAREMNTKTIQWKNGITSGTTVGFTASLIRLQSLKESSSLGNIDTLIDPSASIMPEYSVQSLLIPHQKYGQQYFSTKSEDLWNLNVGIGSSHSTLKIRSLYGLSANYIEANRLLKLDQIELLESREEKKLGENGRRASETGLRRRSLQDSSAALDTMLPSPALSPTGVPPLPPSDNEIQTQYSNKQNKFFKTSNHYKDSQNLIKKIKALDIPPLPPDVGACVYFPRDDRLNRDLLDTISVTDMVSPGSPVTTNQNVKNWKPKENAQVASLSEHTRAVNRLAVAPDQSFFASASSDNTVKIWQVKGLDRAAFPRSALTYSKHKGAVFDLAVIENSHSMASCSDDGTIHVWRVDVSGNNNNSNNGIDSENSTSNQNLEGGIAAIRSAGLSVNGLSVIKTVDCKEGPILCIQHFNNDIASIIIFVTLKGIIHGWDLRSSKETFNYSLNPELGYPTCMTIAPDRNWLCIGTSKGYLCVWDLRYNILCKIWRHSSFGPIYKIACCKTSLKGGSNIFGLNINSNNNDGVFLSVAAGNNEAGIWSIPDGGECIKCFRSIPLTSSRIPLLPLPSLNDVSISKVLRYKNDNIQSSSSEYFNNNKSKESSENVIRALMGRISSSSTSYLITAGTDRQIRYWDFTSPMKCFTISGLESAQPKPTFESPIIDNISGKLVVCYDSHMPTQDTILQSHVPLCENRGPISVLNNYKDAILDLKSIDTGTYQRLMISCGRDGEIKLWR